MEFPASRIISAKSLSQMIKEAAESGQRFCFILGSGASVESGIPSGGSLEMQWMDCLMGRMEDRGMPPMDAGETRRIAEALHGEQALDQWFSSNCNVDVHAYPEARRFCVVNNTYEPQSTTVWRGDSSSFFLELGPNEIRWYQV